MEKSLTELVFILDMSGSMADMTEDTIGGYNTLLEEHKGDKNTLVTTILFNDRAKTIHDRAAIDKVNLLTKEEYRTCGSTALVDAFASTIEKIAMIHKYARKEDVPGKTIFTVITDGYENASRKFTSEQLRKKVKHEKEKYGWEFLFIGANIDAYETASQYGIDHKRTANYVPDAIGNQMVYRNVSRAVNEICMDLPYEADKMIREIEIDFQKRGN